MAEEIKPIIKVDTGESQRTVKALKKDISDLKDQILNLTKGTKEYDDAVDKLQQSQRELNEVQALTKRTATALEGSYDALTHQMSLLKKEWKATADETKRAQIGEEIAKINNELKQLDAEIGNYQRNVGNYVSHWEGMPEVTKDFGTAMREMNEQIEPTKQGLEGLGNLASGLAAGYAAVQGAAALLGVENSKLEQTFVKLQAAMALAQGVSGMKGLVEGFGKLKVVLGSVAGGGMVAVVAAVAAGVALLIKKLIDWRIETLSTKSAVDNYKISVEQLTEANNMLANSVGKPISQFKIFKSEFEELNTDKAKEQWIRDNASAFEELGLQIGSVNDADKIFIQQSDEVIAAMMKRAKADAIKEMYAKSEADVVKAEIQARTDVENLPQSFYSNSDSTIPKEYEKYAGFYTYQGQSKYATREDWSGGGFYNRVGNPTETQAFQTYVENETKELKAVSALWLESVKNAEKEYNEAVKGLGGLYKPEPKPNPKPTGNKPKTKEELLAEIQQKMYDDIVNMTFDDVDVDVKDDFKITDKDGQAEKRANIRIKAAERVAQREIDLNSMAEQSEEERAAKELEIRRKLEEEKLQILKEAREEAVKNGDLAFLEIDQQIADQEIAIEKAKYEELERQRQADLEKEKAAKEKKIQIMNQVSQAISAAGSITQGILEITQAAAEKDGEITEEEAKRIKGMQYATASINMLQGAITAFSSAMQLGPVLGPIVGGVNAAAVVAMGTANLMKIRNTDLTGKVSSGAMGAVTPSSNVFGTDIPMSYVRNVTTASEVDSLNQDTRVYILESDIQASNKKVQVRENESTF